jgi:hypothetical protein
MTAIDGQIQSTRRGLTKSGGTRVFVAIGVGIGAVLLCVGGYGSFGVGVTFVLPLLSMVFFEAACAAHGSGTVSLKKIGAAKKEGQLDSSVLRGIGAMDGVAFDGFGIELPNSALGRIGGVRRTHHLAEL